MKKYYKSCKNSAKTDELTKCRKVIKNNKGITLVVLITTVIMLMILTGISISTLFGKNSILDKSAEAKLLAEISQLEEEANLEFLKRSKDDDDPLDDIVDELKKQGYEIKRTGSSGSTVTGISLDKESVSISKNSSETITVTIDGETTTENVYYAVIKGKYYLINLNDEGIEISKTETNPEDIGDIVDVASVRDKKDSSNLTVSAVSSDNGHVTIEKIDGNVITLDGIDAGDSTITVTYGTFSATCSANVVVRPNKNSPVVASTKFSTEYGSIDIIWLSGNGKTVSPTPNAPQYMNMTPVTWTKSGNTWTEDQSASSPSYSYTAGSGTSDYLESRWANAKNADGSYFVWIPRFAYRITYFSDQAKTTPSGYYDGWGQWRASDASVRIALDSGIDTVDYNGNKYIVHPAFCGTSVGYDNGSWSENIAGFWIAKYEMSRTGATASSAGTGTNMAFLSIPGVQSATKIKVGDTYTVSRNYDSSKQSHLIKNSEWGAVTYLAYSKYGRNGNEIDINNSKVGITGNGGGATSVAAVNTSSNAYNTTTGAKASTTGNIYGVYDMSGGNLEYVAAFNDVDTGNYESTNGSSFASPSNSSDQYATIYHNDRTVGYGNLHIYSSKIGDGIKEVNLGGTVDLDNEASLSTGYDWLGGQPNMLVSTYPFMTRGGKFNTSNLSSMFTTNETRGTYNTNNAGPSFRVILCPAGNSER